MKRFDPGAPIELSPRAGGPGLGRVLLFGCAGLLVLLGIGAVVFVMKADDFLGWVFGSFQESVEARLPPDLPPAQRARLDRAFDAAIEDIVTGDADPAAMQALQQELLALTAGAEGETLTREQVAAMTVALEAVAGIASPEPPPRRARQVPPPAGQPPPDGTSPPESAPTADAPARTATAEPRPVPAPPAAPPATAGERTAPQPERRTAPAAEPITEPAGPEPSAAPAPRRSTPPARQEPGPEEPEPEAEPQDLAPVIRLPPDEPPPEQDPPEEPDEPPARPL